MVGVSIGRLGLRCYTEQDINDVDIYCDSEPLMLSWRWKTSRGPWNNLE